MGDIICFALQRVRQRNVASPLALKMLSLDGDEPYAPLNCLLGFLSLRASALNRIAWQHLFVFKSLDRTVRA